MKAFKKANTNFLTRIGHIYPLRPKISSQSCWFVMLKNDLVLLKCWNIHGFKDRLLKGEYLPLKFFKGTVAQKT